MPKESVLLTLYATPNPLSFKGVTFCIATKITALAKGSHKKKLGKSDQADRFRGGRSPPAQPNCFYRVSFLTGPAQKSSKYGTGPAQWQKIN